MVIPALTHIVEALLNGGLLIVGNSEQLPAGDFPPRANGSLPEHSP
jgi:hypothetical protein